MIDKKLEKIARALDNVRRDSLEPGYQLAVRAMACEVANSLCTAETRFHFFLLCGIKDFSGL